MPRACAHCAFRRSARPRDLGVCANTEVHRARSRGVPGGGERVALPLRRRGSRCRGVRVECGGNGVLRQRGPLSVGGVPPGRLPRAPPHRPWERSVHLGARTARHCFAGGRRPLGGADARMRGRRRAPRPSKLRDVRSRARGVRPRPSVGWWLRRSGGLPARITARGAGGRTVCRVHRRPAGRAGRGPGYVDASYARARRRRRDARSVRSVGAASVALPDD